MDDAIGWPVRVDASFAVSRAHAAQQCLSARRAGAAPRRAGLTGQSGGEYRHTCAVSSPAPRCRSPRAPPCNKHTKNGPGATRVAAPSRRRARLGQPRLSQLLPRRGRGLGCDVGGDVGAQLGVVGEAAGRQLGVRQVGAIDHHLEGGRPTDGAGDLGTGHLHHVSCAVHCMHVRGSKNHR